MCTCSRNAPPVDRQQLFYSISNIGTWEKVRKNAVQIKTNVSGTGYRREITVMKRLRVVKTRTRRPSSFRLLMPDNIQMRAFYTVLRDDGLAWLFRGGLRAFIGTSRGPRQGRARLSCCTSPFRTVLACTRLARCAKKYLLIGVFMLDISIA